MFEKEAEKHADGIYYYKINVSDYGEEGIINYRYSDVKEAYQKGAEFGYNKALEKLKCCANCKHWYESCEVEPSIISDNGYCDKWEMGGENDSQ